MTELHGYEIEDTPEQACQRCTRCGIVSHPWILGDPLDISVMIIGQNPGFPDKGAPNPHKAFFGHSFTCELFMQIVSGMSGIYLTNVVKCAAIKDCERGQIRKCASFFLHYELAFFNPKVVLCVGNVAEQAVIDATGKEWKDRIVKVTHPGYIKRMNWSEDEIAQYADDVYQIISSSTRCNYD